MEIIDIGDLSVKYGGRILKAEVIVTTRLPSVRKIESLGKRIEREIRGEKLNLCMMRIQSSDKATVYEAMVNSDEDEHVVIERIKRLSKIKRINLVAQILVYEAGEDTIRVVEGMIAEAKKMALNPNVKKW